MVHLRAQSGQRRGWGEREFGSGRTQRRCAGGVAAGGVARGEMGEILSMTSGVSMHAMTRNVPPHTPQCSMSMRKTRLSRCIQLMGVLSSPTVEEKSARRSESPTARRGSLWPWPISTPTAPDVSSNEFAAAGGATTAVEVDVARSESGDAMVKAVLREHGRVDVLVNNAGVRAIKGFLEHTEEDWNWMLAVNLTGPFLCSKAVLPSMLETGKGKIVNLAPIVSFTGRPERAGYVATKTGLLGLTRAMAVDMAGRNIYINAIAPGLIASPFNARFAEASDTGPAWGKETLIARWGVAGGHRWRSRVSRVRRLRLRRRSRDQNRRRMARSQDAQRRAG